MSAKSLPLLPAGTPVHNTRRRRHSGARLITNPQQGFIGWVEPVDIPGVTLALPNRVMYYWKHDTQHWCPVAPHLRPGAFYPDTHWPDFIGAD